MSKQNDANQLRAYVVVGRTPASAIFGADEEMAITYRYGECEPAEIVFRTRYLDKGYEVPVPEDLWVEARGKAMGLIPAAEMLANGARDLATIISVSVNASMGKIDIELAFDSTPGVQEHEYFQSFVPEKNLTVVPGRKIDCRATAALVIALTPHSDRERIMRAISQYSLALEYWSPGSELLCVAHLFMGIEALKSVALKQHLHETGLTKEQLGERWGYRQDGRESIDQYLDHGVRMRILYGEDAESHQKAKHVSDNFEHGFRNFGDLRPKAREVVVATARHLRTSIIRLAGVDDEVRDLLLATPFDTPRGPLKLTKYLWGQLLGDTENLAAEGQKYPICHWKSSLEKVVRNKDGGYSFSPKETFTMSLGSGVSFTPGRFEVWDGSCVQEVPHSPVQSSTS